MFRSVTTWIDQMGIKVFSSPDGTMTIEQDGKEIVFGADAFNAQLVIDAILVVNYSHAKDKAREKEAPPVDNVKEQVERG